VVLNMDDLSETALNLSPLIPPGIFVGTSLILRRGGRLLYGIRPPRLEGQRPILELTGIGGGMEPEDVSLRAGVLREVQEEIGCAVHLLSSSETMVVRGPACVQRLSLDGEERPAAVVFRHYRTPPHQPWHKKNRGQACVVVFWGELEGQPVPTMELSALAWLAPAHVVQTARRDVPLRELLDSGVGLIEGQPGGAPATAWVRLTDSQEALVLALGDQALSFYEKLTGA